MERVLDVYRRPYRRAFPVICMDETPRQLIRETRVPIPPRPGQCERYDYEYQRCGVCNVFMATEPLAGKRMTKVTERKTKVDWAHFLGDIAERYSRAKKITLVMDNLNTLPKCALRGLSPGEGQSGVGPVRVRLHPQARELAERHRNRAQRHDQPVPEPTHRLDRGATPGGVGLADHAGSSSSQGELTVHYRRCSHQAKASVSDI